MFIWRPFRVSWRTSRRFRNNAAGRTSSTTDSLRTIAAASGVRSAIGILSSTAWSRSPIAKPEISTRAVRPSVTSTSRISARQFQDPSILSTRASGVRKPKRTWRPRKSPPTARIATTTRIAKNLFIACRSLGREPGGGNHGFSYPIQTVPFSSCDPGVTRIELQNPRPRKSLAVPRSNRYDPGMRTLLLTKTAAVLFAPLCAEAQSQNRDYPPAIEGAMEFVYKEASGAQLKLWAFAPKGWKVSDSRPGIVFFFGGGWKGGSPSQFVPHSEYLAGRGMVAMVADYRVSSRHGTKAKDCVDDARDALRYVRANAGKLGVDPNRIAAGGGSAGGHIAACLGVIEEDPASKPNAMALFNPACVLAPIDGMPASKLDRLEEMKDRMGAEPQSLSPAHHVTSKAPPCVIFHGKADTTVPYATAELFAEKMKENGVPCVLHGYEGEGHGFFNASRKSNAAGESAFPKTLAQLDAFLVDLGWLEK